MPERIEGRAGKAPGDLLHIDMCGPYTTTIGGNHYMFYAVDAATGYIANYALRRKSDAVAAIRQCIVDLAHKAGTRIRSVRGDCDLFSTSKDFRDFCSTMGIAVKHSPPRSAAIQWGSGECNPTLQQNRHGIPPRRGATLGAGGVLMCSRLGCSRGQALGGIGEGCRAKLNQADSPSNPGRASPQEMFTGKEGAFLVVPFFQYGFMHRERRLKLDDKAVPCYLLNAGDNHADCCVKVTRADTGRVCYSSNVTWAPLPQSGGGGSLLSLSLPRQHRPPRRGCHSRLPRRRPPLLVPTLPPPPCRRPPLPVRRLQQPPGRHHRCCRRRRRPRTHPALTPRRRPDRLVCRPPLPVRRLRTRPALTSLARRCPPLLVRRLQQPPGRHHRCCRRRRRLRIRPALTLLARRRPPLPVRRLQQPPGRHHRCCRRRRRPRTHPALTPRRRPDRRVCRLPLPVRRLRTRAALTSLARRRLPLPVRRLQQPPGHHHRCCRHHRRPRTHPALTPRSRPDRRVCRPPLPVRHLRTCPSLTHRLPHVR